MHKFKKIAIFLLFFFGMILTVGAPYFPSALYQVIYSYSQQFYDIRFINLIPSIRAGGIVLSAWGIALLYKK